jgi:predicted helicase
MSMEDQIVTLWKMAYEKFPRATLILTIVVVIGAGLGIFIGVREERQRDQELARRRLENLSYSQQLESLNNVQSSLNNLIAFVEMQKVTLKESEDLVNSLKTEREKLKPVVQADRKTVDALLALQSERIAQNASRERWYGFGLGVLSSILASFILSLIAYVIRRRRAGPAPA